MIIEWSQAKQIKPVFCEAYVANSSHPNQDNVAAVQTNGSYEREILDILQAYQYSALYQFFTTASQSLTYLPQLLDGDAPKPHRIPLVRRWCNELWD